MESLDYTLTIFLAYSALREYRDPIRLVRFAGFESVHGETSR